MPTLCAAKSNPVVRACYQRLRERGKPAKVAIIAAMRKLLAIIYAIAKRRSGFELPAPIPT